MKHVIVDIVGFFVKKCLFILNEGVSMKECQHFATDRGKAVILVWMEGFIVSYQFCLINFKNGKKKRVVKLRIKRVLQILHNIKHISKLIKTCVL